MSEIIKIQKVLHFKSVGKNKKTVTFCTNRPTKSDVDRVNSLRLNKGNNKGDSTLMFGSKKAVGYTSLPNFGVNYFVALDTTSHKQKELPKVGEEFTIEVFNEFTEKALNLIQEDCPNYNELNEEQKLELLMDNIHLSVPTKPVISDRTKKPLTNCFWGYLPS